MPPQTARYFKVKGYNQGQVIFREGQDGSYACIVNSGEVDVFKDVDGRPMLLARLGRGAVFGEMALISSERRTATVVAATYTEVVVLEHERFQKTLAASNPLLQAIVKGLVERLAHTNAMLHNCAAPEGRALALAHLIEALAECAPADENGRARLVVKHLSDLASKILGLSGKELERLVSQLAALGPLSFEHGPQGRELALTMPSKLSIKLDNLLAKGEAALPDAPPLASGPESGPEPARGQAAEPAAETAAGTPFALDEP
ncbi:MAG: Crp/Fnr family transcriptional regulator [Pseudomonadota bacterium]